MEKLTKGSKVRRDRERKESKGQGISPAMYAHLPKEAKEKLSTPKTETPKLSPPKKTKSKTPSKQPTLQLADATNETSHPSKKTPSTSTTADDGNRTSTRAKGETDGFDSTTTPNAEITNESSDSIRSQYNFLSITDKDGAQRPLESEPASKPDIEVTPFNETGISKKKPEHSNVVAQEEPTENQISSLSVASNKSEDGTSILYDRKQPTTSNIVDECSKSNSRIKEEKHRAFPLYANLDAAVENVKNDEDVPSENKSPSQNETDGGDPSEAGSSSTSRPTSPNEDNIHSLSNTIENGERLDHPGKISEKTPEIQGESSQQMPSESSTGSTISRRNYPEDRTDKLIVTTKSADCIDAGPTSKSIVQSQIRRTIETDETAVAELVEPKEDVNNAGENVDSSQQSNADEELVALDTSSRLNESLRSETTKPPDDYKHKEEKEDAMAISKEHEKAPSDGDKGDHDAVVAIDFGTSNTGIAFSYRPNKYHILTSKHGGMLQEEKVPTVVLLNKEKTLVAFGIDALERYENLPRETRKNYFLFEYFKMALYRSETDLRHSKLKDLLGREVDARHVFTECIKYFHDMALRAAVSTYHGLEEERIHWILTIPAIWTDSARQFMKEAAVLAGINGKRLRLVLEPEAASLVCQDNRLEITISKRTIRLFKPGTKYILADLGGGTADICAHEVLPDTKLKELYRATGGDLGGNVVTDNYRRFLESLFTKQVWTEFIEMYPYLYFKMIREFETKKNVFTMKTTDSISVSMEQALRTILKERTNIDLAKQSSQTKHKDDIAYDEKTGNLIIKKNALELFFRRPVNGILDKLQEIVESCGDTELMRLILVGGFAESPYVRERIEERFPQLDLQLFPETRMAVLKGAVIMGYMPTMIIQRRSRFTYGFAHRVPFEKGKHPDKLKRSRDGKDYCVGVFDKIIEIGEVLQRGQVFKRNGRNTALNESLKHKDRSTTLWRSNRKNPIYCYNEPGQEDCCEVGRIVIRTPPGGWPDYWEGEEHLIVGETEFTVRAVNTTDGQVCQGQMEFL